VSAAGRPDGLDASSRPSIAGLVQHARGPLGRGAFYLSLNQAVVSGLGFVFWILAARTYHPQAVGQATSLVAVGVFLAILSTLGLPYALVRHLPSASHPRQLATRVLALTAGVGSAFGAAGAVLLAALSPDFAFLVLDPVDFFLFAAFVAVFTVEVVLEQALVAGRRSELTTVMLLAFGLLRLAGPLLAPGASARELLLAWAASMGVAVVISLLAFLPRALATIVPPAGAGGKPVRLLLSYAGANHAVTLLALAGPSLLPAALFVVLAGPQGASAAATFYIAYQVAALLLTVSVALALVQFAEGARPGADWRADEHRAIGLGLVVVVPGAIAAAAFAPAILSLFGPVYAEQGYALLQVLALASIASVPATILASRYRLAAKFRRPVAASALSSGIALAGAVVTVPAVGLTGAGWAFLGGQVLAALVLRWRRGPDSQAAGGR